MVDRKDFNKVEPHQHAHRCMLVLNCMDAVDDKELAYTMLELVGNTRDRIDKILYDLPLSDSVLDTIKAVVTQSTETGHTTDAACMVVLDPKSGEYIDPLRSNWETDRTATISEVLCWTVMYDVHLFSASNGNFVNYMYIPKSSNNEYPKPTGETK